MENREFHFGYVENIDIEVLSNHCEIVKSTDGGTHIQAQGDDEFMERLRVESEGDCLRISFKREGFSGGGILGVFGSSLRNSMSIHLPCDRGGIAKITVNGSGELASQIGEFSIGKITVNGSGDVNMGDFTDIKATINGSGDVHIGKVKNAAVAVHGSGDISIEYIEGGAFSATVVGSGDVTVGGGECEKFHASVVGSGDVDAANVTAAVADVVIRGSGDVDVNIREKG